MRQRYENGDLLADFSYRGWNPQILVQDMEKEDYNKFIDMCETEYGNLDSMALSNAIHVLMLLSSETDLS